MGLVRGSGGGVGVGDCLREVGVESRLAALRDADEALILFVVGDWDYAGEVGVHAIGVEFVHGVSASEDGVAVMKEGTVKSALPR